MGMADKYLQDNLNKDMANRMQGQQENGGGMGNMLGGLDPMSIAKGGIDGIAQIGKVLSQGNFD